MIKVVVVFGTRPEAVKLAPVIRALKDRCVSIRSWIVVTSQHKSMLRQVLKLFKIEPDYDLDIMRSDQDLFDISVSILSKIKIILTQIMPDIVLVQGDTSTTFLTALASYYLKIKVGHVEAGLRTNNKYSPFPEEINRRLVGAIADIHFAPTQMSFENLEKENVKPENILITGNTSIDALFYIKNNILPNIETELRKKYPWIDEYEKSILITAHRRENFGKPLFQIVEAIKTLHDLNPGFCFTFPVHLNPNIKKIVHRELEHLERLHLIEPVDYSEFIYLMKKAHLILSDSGGVQEEAPSLGKPVLIIRETTERPEGIDAGTNILVGTNKNTIVESAMKLILNSDIYQKMAQSKNPFGDGEASRRIVEWIVRNC